LGVDAPEGAGDAVRLVEAEGFDCQPCGGTHPRSTAEVGAVVVLGHERYKAGTRIRFVCGQRALTAFHARAQVVDRLGGLFSASLADLPQAAERLIEKLVAERERSRDLLERALDGEARRLLAANPEAPAVVVACYDGWGPEDLRGLAARLVTLAPSVVFLGSRAEKAHLVFAQSEGLPHDIPRLVAEAAKLLGGRGGGRGNLAQAGGEQVERLTEALASAAAAAREAARRP
jgi:alanyl-tRNA synthetase